MINRFLKFELTVVLITVFLLSGFSVLAVENLEDFCQKIITEDKPSDISNEEYESLLRECQDYYQGKSDEIEKDINRTEQEKDTLKNKIYILGNKVKNLDYQIYQGNVMIKDLNVQIKNTESSIGETSSEIDEIKKNLLNLLQLRYKEDQKSYLEILLVEENLSDFFSSLIALDALNEETQKLLRNVRGLKTSLEGQKESMDSEKNNLEGVVTIQKIQKKESAETKKAQENFLQMTEVEYQKYLKEKGENEKIVAEIRARIFALVGVPEAPTFGEALDLAKYVENITNVRPAFLLAILKQESNIGQNVGRCYLKDTNTGSGIVVSSGKYISQVMKPTRDVQPFLSITKELGRNPFETPISCPMSSGYGGAMGPAQFIPSTWVIYRDKVKAITGKPADPWNIKDSFLAAALYLSDYGAAKRNYDSEWRAAMIYFSGTTRRTSYNGYGFYGDSVIEIEKDLQKDIEAIESAQ